jgi:hypothetical protein
VRDLARDLESERDLARDLAPLERWLQRSRVGDWALSWARAQAHVA